MNKTFKAYFYAISLVMRKAPGYGLLAIIDSVLRSLSNLAFNLILLGLITDSVIQGRNFVETLPFVLVVVGAMLLSGIVKHIKSDYFRETTKNKITEHINALILEKSISLDIARYEDSEFYETFYLIVKNADQKVFDIFDESIEIIALIISLAGTVTILWSISAVYLVFCICALLINGITMISRNRLRYSYDINMTKRRKRSEYFNRIFYLPEYIKEIKINNLSTIYKEKNKANYADMLSLAQRFGKRIAVLGLIVQFIADSVLIDGLLFAKMSYDVLVLKTLSVGNVITILRGVSNLQWTVSDLIDKGSHVAINTKYIGKMLEFLALNSQLSCGESIPEVTTESMIEFKNVSFCYLEGGRQILNDVNMKIHLGEKTAIVGLNGAGKSTLFKLLLRFYDPTKGSILLDGTDIKQFDLVAYRRLFSCVFQDFNIYAASVEENIAMDSEFCSEEIIAAGDELNIGSVLDRYGLTYASHLGKELYEDGVDLSGGEKQKIAIARIFTAQNAKVFLLDEPTSYLDAKSDFDTMHAISNNLSGKGMVIISHHLPNITDSAQINVMEDGRVIEQGTHSELMALDGEYATMYKVQAKRYMREEYNEQ